MAFAYLLEAVQLAFTTNDGFRVFVSGRDNILQLGEIGLYWFDSVILIAISEYCLISSVPISVSLNASYSQLRLSAILRLAHFYYKSLVCCCRVRFIGMYSSCRSERGS